jgi:hypothetical protein
MSCNCGCTNTTVSCNCPDPGSISAAKIENIVSEDFEGGQDIYNGGAGYLHTLYTNTSSGNQIVYVQTNSNITCTTTHDITSEYYVNATNVGTVQQQTTALTATDHTHFMITQTLGPGDILKIKFLSSHIDGKLEWLVSFIYKYDI